MDPSIMKLLEEDEDETMHSGADVEAFQAALNRDIGGDPSSSSQPPDSGSVLSQESNQMSSQQFPNWQPTQDENANHPSQQDVKNVHQQQQQEQQSSVMELKQHATGSENQQHQGDISHQKQSQDAPRQGQAGQVLHNTPQTTGMQISEKNPNPISGPKKTQNPGSESQYIKFQKMANQQPLGMEHPGNLKSQGKQIPFVLLLPALKPHLDKDREMQLQTLFNKLRKNEIAKDHFVRLMRNIVGDQVLKLAVAQLQSQGGNQSQLQSQVLSRQHQVRMPVGSSATQFTDPHSFVLNQKGSSSSLDPSHNTPPAVQGHKDTSFQSADNALKDSHGIHMTQMSSSNIIVKQEREHPSIAMQGPNKQQQQHLHYAQSHFSMYGSSSGTYHPYAGPPNVKSPGSSMKPQPNELQMRQIPNQQGAGASQGGPTQAMNMISAPKFERQNSINDPNRVQAGSVSHYTDKSTLQNSASWQAQTNKEQVATTFTPMNYVKQEPVEQAAEQQQKPQLPSPQGLSGAPVEQGNAVSGKSKDDFSEKQTSRVGFSTPSSVGPANPVPRSITAQLQQDPNLQNIGPRNSSALSSGMSGRTAAKKPSAGQKKPLEAPGSSPPMPSKKQKASGNFLDQSIEQLNDVTAVSGVNLREEEEQLFSGPKEDSRASEASRRVVQEEEEKLILQKTPLEEKLAEIMAKCGLRSISSDVERCLSLCVEERMRGLISNLIRFSKQRVDIEKPRHHTLITSDVRQQIMMMNRKAREEWDKKQAEAERLRKINDPESESGTEGEKEKDEGRAKTVKANKDEDDKMRTTAANVAARAAVGGDDMLSKWQLMAEQKRQQREGSEGASGSQPAKDATRKPLTSGRNVNDNQGEDKRSPAASSTVSAAIVRKAGRNSAVVPQARVSRTISVKEVIAVLEREPQMSKSTLIYRLYERIRSDSAPE